MCMEKYTKVSFQLKGARYKTSLCKPFPFCQRQQQQQHPPIKEENLPLSPTRIPTAHFHLLFYSICCLLSEFRFFFNICQTHDDYCKCVPALTHCMTSPRFFFSPGFGFHYLSQQCAFHTHLKNNVRISVMDFYTAMQSDKFRT